jgi:phage protein U
MARPIFQLGSFQFDLPNGVPQSLDRTADYRWETQDRLLRDPAVQFLGPGSQEITLDGVLFPGFSGRQTTVEALRTLAAEGKPQILTDGLGRNYGKWVIRQVREGLSTFAPGGGARQITFNVSLLRYVDDNPGQAASPLSFSPVALSSSSTTLGSATAAAAAVPAWTGSASAFDATGWAFNPANSTTALAARNAGFSLAQLGNISRSVVNGDYVGAALNAFGLNGLTTTQTSTWAQLGIAGARMVEAMVDRRGPAAMTVALEALRPATAAQLQAIGGGPPGEAGLSNLIRDAATIGTMLNVDPFITGIVQQLVRP